jgi:hypothetical protein
LDDELDVIKVQNSLRESLLARQPSRRESQHFAQRPAMQRLLTELEDRLRDGVGLDVESMLDVLTLGDAGYADPVIALDRLRKDTVSVDIDGMICWN